MMQRLVILASGSGSNAQKIIEYFIGHRQIIVVKVLANRSDAGVLERAHRLGVATAIFDKAQMNDGRLLSALLKAADWLILAGFLWKIPSNILTAYQDRVINIHPSLLPRYGGKGMYGMYVHRAVYEAGDAYTGITIHLVNDAYDEGAIIFQEKVALSSEDHPEEISKKVQALEHRYFPLVIEQMVLKSTNA